MALEMQTVAQYFLLGTFIVYNRRSLRQFIDQIKGKVLKSHGSSSCKELNGEFLMDVFHRRPIIFQPSQAQGLEELNACRLFLQVITLANITDGSGTYIPSNFL